MKSTQLVATASLSLLLSAAASFAADPPAFESWAVDPLIKVFRDDEPQPNTKALAEVARGEHATFQVVVRPNWDSKSTRIEVSPLTLDGDASRSLRPSAVRFVGYVPVDRPIQTPPKDQLRRPPADFPDPLLEVETLDIGQAEAQPIWITVPIPTDAAPGSYRGTVTVTGVKIDRTVDATLPISIQVHSAVVGRSRLWVTNWFTMQWRHMSVAPKHESPEYWQLLRRYARNMAEHRQNVALISPLSLADFSIEADAQLGIDFARFDKWVEIFISEGVIGRIEGGHVGGRSKGWHSPFVVRIRQIADGKVQSASVDPSSPKADRFYGRFLPALVKHLKAKGWLDRYTQHLADEPTVENMESYRAIARLICKYAPELKIIEACHTKDLVGAI